MGYLSDGDMKMNMDSVKNADYKGMLAKATDLVRKMNDKYDDYLPEPSRSVGMVVLGAVLAAVTSGVWTVVAIGAAIGFRLWGTLKR